MMAWKIDRDYINDGVEFGIPSREGTGQWPDEQDGPEGETFRFRLLDDDGEVYYGGYYDEAASEDDEEYGGLYMALAWAMHDAGCTDLEVKRADEKARGNLHAAERDTTWYSVYA